MRRRPPISTLFPYTTLFRPPVTAQIRITSTAPRKAVVEPVHSVAMVAKRESRPSRFFERRSSIASSLLDRGQRRRRPRSIRIIAAVHHLRDRHLDHGHEDARDGGAHVRLARLVDLRREAHLH